MNFFGHAMVARERRDEPRHVLGAMVPDFASMVRARLLRADDEELARGIALHHRTDDVFHATPEFVALCADSVQVLESRGVGRGGARAAAHVGVELLLDGIWLDDALARAGYLAALAAGETANDSLAWHDDAATARYQRLQSRLRAWGLPEGYRAPRFVAERIAGALSSRPRLALDDAATKTVEAWAEEIRPRVELAAPAILAAVRAWI